MTPAEVLLAAAETIDRDGLYQGGIRSYAVPHLRPVPGKTRAQVCKEAAVVAPVSVFGAIERVIWGAAQDYLTPHMDTLDYRLYVETTLYFAAWMRWNCGVMNVWRWNDAFSTSEAEVILALRKAAQAWAPPPF
ncbi:hypothetical protein ACFWZR_28425 [Streptomyces sp. NPDC059017]|uniref:DUF6197 family protein n=1 Tax=Streptomyces sp. NPDC059017 TaxID=3346700 RepID=UPI00368FDA5D